MERVTRPLGTGIMTTISSETYRISSSLDTVYAYLTNPSHFEAILPPQKFSDFKSSSQHFQFSISGGIGVSLYLSPEKNSNRITYHHGESSSFPYTLSIDLSPFEDGVNTTFHFEYDAPPFVAMMVKGPLTALMKDMAEQLVLNLNKAG